jgi:hypothetical protein
MSGFFPDFVAGVKNGFFNDNRVLRDYRHASKTFVTDAYSNAPKFKWLFHVYFDINKTEITNNVAQIFPDSSKPSLLVKNIQLPKYSIAVSDLNQYNRHRLIQTKIDYDPITITFHDDNANIIKNLWYTYFNYYYGDPSQPSQLNGKRQQPGSAASILSRKNVYNDNISFDNQQAWGYTGDITTAKYSTDQGLGKAPFFRSIRVYGFNQHQFSGYEMVNPLITNFNHDTYDYYQTTGIMENSMTVKYESVKYFEGSLDGRTPASIVDQFGSDDYYDRERSPLAKAGSNGTILGQNGLLDALGGVYDGLESGDPRGFLQALRIANTTYNTFKNPANIVRAVKNDLVQGAIGIVSNPASYRGTFLYPSVGSGVGTNSQYGSSTNTGAAATPQKIPTPNNNPVQ